MENINLCKDYVFDNWKFTPENSLSAHKSIILDDFSKNTNQDVEEIISTYNKLVLKRYIKNIATS